MTSLPGLNQTALTCNSGSVDPESVSYVIQLNNPSLAGCYEGLWVFWNANSGTPTLSVSDNKGQNWTQKADFLNTAGPIHATLFEFNNTVAGVTQLTVAVNGGGNVAFAQFIPFEAYNVDSTTPHDVTPFGTVSTSFTTAPSPGAFTPNTANDLLMVVCTEVSGAFTGSGAVTSKFTKAAGFTLRGTDLVFGTAMQWQTYQSTTPITSAGMAITSPVSGQWCCVGIALKAAANGSGTQATKEPYIRHRQWAAWARTGVTSLVQQFQSTADNILVEWLGTQQTTTAIAPMLTVSDDTSTNTYTLTVGAGTNTGGTAQHAYKNGSTPGDFLITTTVAHDQFSTSLFTDWKAVGATFDKAVADNTGNQTVAGDLTVASITPTRLPCIVFNDTSINAGFIKDPVSPWIGSNPWANSQTSSGSDFLEEDNGWSWIVPTSLGAIAPTYHNSQPSGGVLNFSTESISFLLPIPPAAPTPPPAVSPIPMRPGPGGFKRGRTRLPLFIAAATVIAPNLAQLVLTGLAPTVTVAPSRIPASPPPLRQPVPMRAQAGGFKRGQVVRGDTSRAILVPVAPGTAALTLTGFAPNVSSTPGTSPIQMPVPMRRQPGGFKRGQRPQGDTSRAILPPQNPGTAQLILTGFLPTVGTSPTPQAAPTTGPIVSPIPMRAGPGGLRRGQVTRGDTSRAILPPVNPGTAQLVLTGFQPIVVASVAAPPPLKSPVPMRAGPGGLKRGSRTQGDTSRAILPPVGPGTAALVLTGFVPTIAVTPTPQVPPSPAPLRMVIPMRPTAGGLTGGRPTRGDTSRAILPPEAPGVASLVLTGFAPVVTTSAFQFGIGQLGFQELDSRSWADEPIGILGWLDKELWGPLAPSPISTNVGLLTLTGFAPTVTGATTTVTPNVGQLTLTGFLPLVTTGTTVAPNVGQLTLTGFAPVLSSQSSGQVVPNVGQLVLTGYPPTIIMPQPTQVSLIAYQQAVAPPAPVDVPAPDTGTSTPPPISPQAGGPVGIVPASLRFRLTNAPATYDQRDQQNLRVALTTAADQFSQQFAKQSTDIRVTITQLDPSPASDKGVTIRFLVHAFDPEGQVIHLSIVGLQGTGVSIVSGPAVGVVAPNDTIWKVTLANPSAGPGQVIVRAETPDGRTTDVSIPIVPQAPINIVTTITIIAPASDVAAQTQITVQVTAVDPRANGGAPPLVALTNLTSNSSILAGAAVGNYVPSGSQWTLARPAVLKGAAAAEFTGDDAALDGLRATKAYLYIPDQGQQGAPVLTMTVGEDGHVVTQAVGNNDTQSFTYADATATFPSLPTMPSDAAAIAGTIVNGQVVTITSAATLALGDRYMIKVVPWPQTNAGGTHGVIASGQIDRQNKTGTKTLFIASEQFVPASNTMAGGWFQNTGSLRPNAKGASINSAWIVLPAGATMTQLRAYMVRVNGNGQASMTLFKYGTGSLFSVVHSTTGLQILTQSFTEVVANVPYILNCVLDTTASTNANDNQLQHVEIDYTTPDFNTSV